LPSVRAGTQVGEQSCFFFMEVQKRLPRLGLETEHAGPDLDEVIEGAELFQQGLQRVKCRSLHRESAAAWRRVMGVALSDEP